MHNTASQHKRGALITILLVVVIVVVGSLSRPRAKIARHQAATESVATTDSTTLQLRAFDPNEVEYLELTEMGIERDIAVSIIRWREAGKVYRIKEDVALCHAMTDSLYAILEPYIIIGEKYRFHPKSYDNAEKRNIATATLTPFRIDTATVEYLHTLGFTARQAALVVRYRDMIGGYRNFAEFKECYAVDSTMAERLKPYIIFPKEETPSIVATPELVDINSADSATLVRLPGIGAKSAQAIIEYRKLLGGYYDISQIKALSVVTEENFCKFSQQIYCDSARIEKIYINFARPKELEVHPYLSNRMLRQIINHRELKGGWSTIEEMIDSKIFNTEEAARIAPYLDFGTPEA